MEDISRELEREIALSKPKPYKRDRKTKILIVDDFGQMKSGEYLKVLVMILSVVSIICFVAAGLFYSLYKGLSRNASSINSRIVIAEKKVDQLTREKEILMARLVISGKEPGLQKENEVKDKKLVPLEPENADKNKSLPAVEKEKDVIKPELNTMIKPPEEPAAPPEPEQPGIINKTVSIEKFTVTRDSTNGDLLVRFDIRNISSDPGDVSGRIFTLLKPDNKIKDHWLVVPTSALKNGIPSEYRKGQYFSIAHFKPVKFRIKNQSGPEFFKKASIVIFNDQGDLIFEKLIDITEAE